MKTTRTEVEVEEEDLCSGLISSVELPKWDFDSFIFIPSSSFLQSHFNSCRTKKNSDMTVFGLWN